MREKNQTWKDAMQAQQEIHESKVGGMKKHLILKHNEPWLSIVMQSL